MRILHIFLFAILLKNVYCDSSRSCFSSLPKPKASPFEVPAATNTKLGKVRPQAPAPSKVTAYLLVVQWPPAVCNGISNIKSKCEIKPVPTEFKIHGLWPQPDGLPTNEISDPNQLTHIATELNKNWPNLKSKQQQISINLKFWWHEWTKHGKYSEMGVLDYFKKTLELFKGAGEGLKTKLAAQNITASPYKTYKLQAIEAALKKINGNFSCTVICNQRNTSKKKQIQEVRFRYTKDFKMQNNYVASSTCGTATTDIMFPDLTN
ncbi:hypothetical protein OROHE_001998 [Orobanche hederae]